MSETTDSPTDIDSDELAIFPAEAPAVMNDPSSAKALLAPVLTALAEVVEVDEDLLKQPTPCRDFDVAGLRRHTLAWLQFFAAALNDPLGETDRLDPETWDLGPGDDPRSIVARARADIEAAIDSGVADALVTMSNARMAGGAVLAMALGEYLVHGWDLATATGRPWSPPDAAAEPALSFLNSTVAAEYRGPDSGFFDEEVPAPADASTFVRLLCFTGRRPE